MLGLILDVFDQRVLVLQRNREGPVAILPAREFRKDILLLDPFARSRFDLLHIISERKRGRNRNKDVDVILHTTDAVQLAAEVAVDAPNVAIEIFPASLGKRSPTILRRENHMVKNLGERVWHVQRTVA